MNAECDGVTQRNTSRRAPLAIIILCKCLVAIVLSGRSLSAAQATGSSVRAKQTRRTNSAQNGKKMRRFPRFISGEGRAKSTVAELGTASNAKHNLFKWLERLCWFWEEPFGGESRSMCRDFKQPPCQEAGFRTGLAVWLKPRQSTITLRGNGERVHISSASVFHIPSACLENVSTN